MTDPASSTTETPTNRVATWSLALGLAAGTALSGACVAPATSSMSLGSVSSMSGSSASSAAHNARRHSAYHIDVRESTAAAILAQSSTAEVLRSVGRAAAEHGISDWEVEQGSYVALGEGLHLAGLDPNQARAWISRLSGGDAETSALITKGYRNA